MSIESGETDFSFEPGEPIDLGVQQIFVDRRADRILEELRCTLVNRGGFGVSVQGTYLTLRYGRGSRLVSVTMQVHSITDSEIRA